MPHSASGGRLDNSHQDKNLFALCSSFFAHPSSLSIIKHDRQLNTNFSLSQAAG
jgi:hypothetical protein